MPSRWFVERYHLGSGTTVAHPRCTTNRDRLNLREGGPDGPILLQIGLGPIDPPCLAEVSRFRSAMKVRGDPYHLTLRAALAGTTTMRFTTGRLRLAAGSYVLENPKDFAQFEPGEGFNGVTLAFSQELLRRYRDDLGIPKTAGPFDFRMTVEPLTPAFKTLVTRLAALAKPAGSGDDEDLWLPPIIEGFGAHVLSWLWTHHPNGLRERLRQQGHEFALDPRLLLAVKYLRQHVDQPLNVQAMSLAAGSSRATLFRLFHDQLHVAPRDYFRNMQIDLAKRLLKQDTPPTWEAVARQVGFQSGWALKKALRRTGSLQKPQ